MKIKTYSLILITTVAALMASCGNSEDNKSAELKQKEAQLKDLKSEYAEMAKTIANLEKEIALSDTTKRVKSKEVVAVTLAPRKFDQYVQTQGSVEANDNIMVSAKSMGVVSQVYVREGDAVVKGQTLAQIDNSIVVRGVEELKSSMELVNTIYEKQKNLWEQKIGTEVQYLQAKNNKESLDKKLATLNEQLEMSKIKSPITGTIDQVNIKIGENAAPGMPVFKVINGNDLRVMAKVSQAYISSIKKGNNAMISFSDYDKKLEAPVTFVGRSIDQLSRSFTIEVKLPSLNELRPNMTAVLRVIFKSVPNALCVPVNVVQEINGEKIVYIAESDGKQAVARKRVVLIDGVYDNQAQVTSGLKEGDKVITVGYQGLNDGQLIKI
jgi:membrane fusion protein, multidrug efflux system